MSLVDSLMLKSQDGEGKGGVDATYVTTSPEEKRAATLLIASLTTDVEDCAMILDMLGLDPNDARL